MNKKSMERSPNDKCNKCAQSCSGGSNVWVEVVPGIVIVLIVYSPKPCGKLIPVEVSSGAGLKWLYICPPRNINSWHLIWGPRGGWASLATLRQPWSEIFLGTACR